MPPYRNAAYYQNLALLPGAEIIIRENADCVLGAGKSIYVYDRDEWVGKGYVNNAGADLLVLPFAPGRTGNRNANSLVDALIQVDGKVDASAGYIYTTAGGANICSTGTGKIKTSAGTQTVTYQVIQSSNTVGAWADIPITPAQLKHADGTYLISATGTYNYCSTHGMWYAGECEKCKPACEHNYTSAVTTAPTCTEKGIKTYTCTCGDTYTEEIAATGHTEVVDAAVAATCTTTGLTEGKHCSVCGTVTVAQTVVDALGHTEDIDAAVAPTCTETGLTEGKHCSVCGTVTVAQTVVNALGHTPGEDWGYDDGCHWHVCATCGTELEKNPHDFQNGTCECGMVGEFTVTWNVDGETTTTEQKYGEKLTLPNEPTKVGHTFLGWFTSQTGGDQVTAETTYQVAGETTYYARWEVNEYTVTWYVDDAVYGEPYEGLTYGSSVIKPADPAKDKVECTVYAFVGWAANEGGEVLTTLPNVTENASYHAVFAEKVEHEGVENAVWTVKTPATYTTAPVRAAECATCGVEVTDPYAVSASLNGTSYETLQMALNVAQKYDTITLLTDVVYDAETDSAIGGKSLIFAHNGHSIETIVAEGYEAYTDAEAGITVVKENPFKIAATSISAGDSLDLWFYVWEYDLEGHTDYKAVVTKEFADGRDNVVETIPFTKWEYKKVSGVPYYRFVFSDISAKEMMDNISVMIYDSANKPASVLCNETVEDYAFRTLNGETARTDPDLTTALVDMLNYGASSQIRFAYNDGVDKLANIRIGEFENQATLDGAISNYESQRSGSSNLKATTLSAKNQIILTFYFEGIDPSMSAEAIYTYVPKDAVESKTATIKISGDTFYYNKTYGWYGVDVTGIPFADGAELVTCTVKDSAGKEVAWGKDSIVGHCVRNAPNESSEIFTMMQKFVHSANEYFRK